MTYSVYILKSPNGKVYVGVTKKNPTVRWAYGKGYKQNKELYADIRKYGWNKFDKEILFTTESREEAAKKEIQMISEYKSTDTIRGYNKLPGGRLMSDETIERMRNTYEGRYPHWCEKKNQSILARARRSRTLRNLHRSVPKRGESPVARKIDCYDKSMNFIERFSSIMDACDKYQIDHASIVNCCKGNRPSAGGFVWSFRRRGSRPQ